MTVIARDAVASDHLVYAWPFPLGPEVEVTCADDEHVVMCPAWLVGGLLGPGRHLWRTPDPSRPVAAFFVLTAPVEVSFDMTTMFLLPATGQPIRMRANGSLQVRCSDPGLLIAQFVGLPFDGVNDGILRSVSRSVERMLARLLTRRVVMAGTPAAVTDASMQAGIIEELVAYNPTAGAVFGVELIRMGHLTIVTDDGSSPYIALPQDNDWGEVKPTQPIPNGNDGRGSAAAAAASLIAQRLERMGNVSMLETARGRPVSQPPPMAGSVGQSDMPPPRPILQSSPEIQPPPAMPPAPQSRGSGEIPDRATSQPGDPPRRGPAVEVPRSTDDITQPGVHTPVPGTLLRASTSPRVDGQPPEESRGAIFGIGMSSIGHGSVSGEIPTKVPPGGRVLVPGPNGLMQSATVRQLLQGYYELEVGHSGETIWVPINGVLPDP